MTAVPAAAQETVPYDILVAQMEAELHRRDSEIVMLNARITVRDRTIAQLREQLAHSGPHRAHASLADQQVQFPPPADQQPVPEVGTQRSAVASS